MASSPRTARTASSSNPTCAPSFAPRPQCTAPSPLHPLRRPKTEPAVFPDRPSVLTSRSVRFTSTNGFSRYSRTSSGIRLPSALRTYLSTRLQYHLSMISTFSTGLFPLLYPAVAQLPDPLRKYCPVLSGSILPLLQLLFPHPHLPCHIFHVGTFCGYIIHLWVRCQENCGYKLVGQEIIFVWLDV